MRVKYWIAESLDFHPYKTRLSEASLRYISWPDDDGRTSTTAGGEGRAG